MSLSGSLPVVKPTFSADFVNTERVDSRLTFARASTATFYDGVTTVKAEENLTAYSQDFTQWSPYTNVVRNSTTEIDPANGTTAGLYTYSAASFVFRQPIMPAGQITISIYAKKGTLNDFYLSVYNNISTSSFGGPLETLTTNWTRYTFTFINDVTSVCNFELRSNSVGTVYFAFAQLEQRSAVTAYTATTTAPITNYIHAMRTAPAGVGRIAHDPITRETLGLHMESAATNLFVYSEQLNTAPSAKTNVTVSENVTVSPSGAITGNKVIATTTSGIHVLQLTRAISTQAYTFSFYAKAGEYSWCRVAMFSTNQFEAFIDLTNGNISGLSASTTCTTTAVGNGWYRIAISASLPSSAEAYFQIWIATSSTNATFAGNGFSGIYVWGAQLETGSLATSYIATTTAQVTRAADTCTLAAPQFDAAIRQGEGTLYAEILPTSASGSFDFGIANLENGVYNNLALRKTAGVFVGYGNTNGIAQFELQLGTDATIPYGVVYKSAVAYAANNFGATSQGLVAKTDSLGVPPDVSSLRVGPDSFTSYFRYNNYIRKVAYYPTRLANLNLEALTL